MLVTILLLMMEVPGRPGTLVPHEVLEVVGVGAEVGVGADAGVEMEEKRRTRVMAQKTATERLTRHLRTLIASVAR